MYTTYVRLTDAISIANLCCLCSHRHVLCCSEYWRSASYLASTTGSLFSALVQTAIEYHAQHKRYQPFSVYQVPQYNPKT
jgi:hypothetical protein